MGSYIPSTGEERQAMLQAIGLTSTDQLFDVVPESVRESRRCWSSCSPRR